MDSPIYLDYAATTPVDERVVAVLSRYLDWRGQFGNPSSHTHSLGQTAANAVATARTQLATLLGASPEEIIWTSGATEANNLALFGAMRAYRRQGHHLVTSQTEHKAVLDVCRRLERDGCAITYLAPDPDGIIPPERVAAALRPDTVLASFMHVNNETGVVQDLAAIGAATRARGVLLHVDAAQSVGKLPLDLRTLPVDLLSVSGHKFYGPKGIGVLFVRRRPRRVRLEPLLYGGGQERGLRPGTLPTHQIAALGEACRIAQAEMTAEQTRIRALRDALWQGLATLGQVTLNGHPTQNAAGILNVTCNGLSAEALLTALPGLALAIGSACTSANHEPSHVLRAMGRDPAQARSAVRFSLGRFTTAAEIAAVIAATSAAVERLRALSPLWEPAQRRLAQRAVDWQALP